MSPPDSATALDFMGLFAGQADLMAPDCQSPNIWRERAEDLAAFLAAHETCLPDHEAFMTLLRAGGLLFLMSEKPA